MVQKIGMGGSKAGAVGAVTGREEAFKTMHLSCGDGGYLAHAPISNSYEEAADWEGSQKWKR